MATVRPSLVQRELDIPAGSFVYPIGCWPEPALLESGQDFGASGRWSIYAAAPRLVFEATGDRWTVRKGAEKSEAGRGDTLVALARLLSRFNLADPADESDPETPPFQGGMIGYLGYDLAPRLERLPRRADRDSRLPDIRMGLYDTFVIVDHRSGTATLHALDLVGEGPSACRRRFRKWWRSLRGPASCSTGGRNHLGPLVSNFTRQAYLDRVRKALDYIEAGDIFQVNLSQRFETRGEVHPFQLYRRLRAASPAPFSAFLRWDDLAVVSASPESFYQTRGGRLITRPIKGTRPRGKTAVEDARLSEQLQRSAKDRAELTMIVDLERNDLGRVCRYGSIRVDDPLTVESFAQVHHLVATVSGDLRPEAAPVDVIRALFPGGSITGAPKIRAMEIIDELEPGRRSVYTGAIGYFSRGGASGFNIAIRTILVDGDRVSYQVGGGIVADSDPSAEYEETLHKGVGLRRAIESREEGP